MFRIIILTFTICMIVYFIKNKIKIDFVSFLKRGFKIKGGRFGVYCYCGKQGSSKTLNVVRFLDENSKNNEKIYANLLSINKERIPYTYIKNLKEMLELRNEHDIIIFYDEIFTEISKLLKTDNKLAKDIMDFLSQMRKRRIILLTTCQEWRLLPMYFRLYVRFQVNCNMRSIPLFHAISIKTIINGDNIKWSEQDQDFIGDLVEKRIWHCEKDIANLYDTNETIGEFSNYTTSASESSDVVELDNDVDFWGEKLTLDDVKSVGEPYEEEN